MVNFYELSANRPNGHLYSFEELKDKVVLVVNTGTQCVFTPQRECVKPSLNELLLTKRVYVTAKTVKELQELHEKYHEKGLVILGCE